MLLKESIYKCVSIVCDATVAFKLYVIILEWYVNAHINVYLPPTPRQGKLHLVMTHLCQSPVLS